MFQFSLRDLLWATAMVAMGTSWWIDSWRIGRAVAEFENDRLQLHKEIIAERKLITAERARVQQTLAANGKPPPAPVSFER